MGKFPEELSSRAVVAGRRSPVAGRRSPVAGGGGRRAEGGGKGGRQVAAGPGGLSVVVSGWGYGAGWAARWWWRVRCGPAGVVWVGVTASVLGVGRGSVVYPVPCAPGDGSKSDGVAGAGGWLRGHTRAWVLRLPVRCGGLSVVAVVGGCRGCC
ncbi:hypothetical protein Sfr7A_32225 [Streptomyces xinghaiensis]|nr:hypothetical protein Sfr7A_32225 [Streptomyces xinghaiensis]RNC69119.1 hypothetical protein DC095_030465 [Streptomyces xinghaiensis]